jgi:hypothetical protein
MSRELAEKKDYLTFTLNEITYLPHYQDAKLYVGPGYPRQNKSVYTSAELLAKGAKASMLHIWKRAEHGKVQSTLSY